MATKREEIVNRRDNREKDRLDFRELVQPDQGLVSRRIFVEDEIYELEQEKIFAHCWLYLGMEKQLPAPGNFLTTTMGEEPVIVWRDPANQLRVFLNSCTHRGMRLCTANNGTATSFSCPYHGWTFNCEGRLTGVPFYKEEYFEALDKDKWGLIEIPKVATYRGMIFANMDEQACSLEDYLGDMKWYLDLVFNRTNGGLEALPGTQRWAVKANWKYGAENFSGDSYHLHTTHASAFQLGVMPDKFKPTSGYTIALENGHGINVVMLPDGRREMAKHVPREHFPYLFYLLDHIEDSERLLGKERNEILQDSLVIGGTIFPNFSFINIPQYMFAHVWQPRGAREMEIWSWCMLESDMPADMKDYIRKNYVNQFGPGGIFEQDDTEMWSQCSMSANGRMSRKHHFNMQMGLGVEMPRPNMPGLKFGRALSESNQREFFRHWAGLMGKDELR